MQDEEEGDQSLRPLKKTRAHFEVTVPPKDKEEEDPRPARAQPAVIDREEMQFQRDLGKATRRSMRDKGKANYVFFDGG